MKRLNRPDHILVDCDKLHCCIPIHRMEAASGRPLGRRPQLSLELSHFVRTLAPEGVVGPSLMPSHTLTLTSAFGLTNAGVLPSVRVLLRSFPRYYNPLGLPLHTARLRLGLIRGRSL